MRPAACFAGRGTHTRSSEAGAPPVGVAAAQRSHTGDWSSTRERSEREGAEKFAQTNCRDRFVGLAVGRRIRFKNASTADGLYLARSAVFVAVRFQIRI